MGTETRRPCGPEKVDFELLWADIPDEEKPKYTAVGINSPEALALAFQTFQQMLIGLLPNFLAFFAVFRYASDKIPESIKLGIMTKFLGRKFEVVKDSDDV